MKELNKFRQFLAEGQINENLGAKLAQNMEVELGMANPGEGDYKIMAKYIPMFQSAKSDEEAKAMLDEFSREMGVYSGTPEGDITSALMSVLEEENVSEGSSKLMSQGKYWVKNNDLGPKTTTADIKKWVDGNFEKYGKPGDDKAKIIADLTAYNDGLNKGNVSENALGVDREDGTFEITPDIEIMGQSFNFSDICPSAHKLVQNQALVHQGFSRTAPIVLNFAILHRDFFALERQALGAQGIDIDTFKNDVTRLYVEILNVAEKLGVRKQAKEYMDMHMGKIKDAGFKASEPGGSSDRMSDYKADMDYYMDETGDENEFLQEKLAEVRNRLANEIEGYTDLHKNDVVLEAFLGESNAESNPLRGIKNMFQAIIPLKLDTDTLDTLKYAKATGIRGDKSVIEFFTENPNKYEKYTNLLNQANKFGVKVNSNTNVLDAYNAISAAANEYELREGSLDERQKYADDQLKFKKGDTVYFKNVKGGKELPMTVTGPGKFMDSNRLDTGGKEIVFPVKGGPDGGGMYAADDLVKEESLNEEIEMVKPNRGHDYYKLNKDVELELQTGSTSVTGAPGVLLHPVFGNTIIAKKGQYIISFFGQLFYVDMDAKFATKVPKHEDSDNKENLRGALVPVDMAPKFRGGWEAYLNKPL